MGIQIITDSTADVNASEAKNLDVSIVPLKTVFDGVEYRDGIDLSPSEFFNKLKHSKNLPTTSQPASSAFEDVFKKAVSNNNSVIALLITENLSGTVQSAKAAKQAVGGNISIIDSGTTTIGLRILVLLAARLRDTGMSHDEIVDTLEHEKKKIHLHAIIATLEYLHKGGRLSKTRAIAGMLFGIKPLLTYINGVLNITGKSRGLKNAYAEILSKTMHGEAIDYSKPVCMGYTGSYTNYEEFQKVVKAELGEHDYYESTIGSVIGTHIGPGASAIAFFEKE